MPCTTVLLPLCGTVQPGEEFTQQELELIWVNYAQQAVHALQQWHG